jgi:protein gp37
MNRTDIEWCDFTWNPIVGCTQGCSFCYARRQARRRKPGVRIRPEDGAPIAYGCQDCSDFRPHLHAERLDQPAHVRRPSIVFCGSMGDLFDPEVDPEWRELVWAKMECRAWWHSFVVLTKRPDLIKPGELHSLSMLWLGVSVTCDDDWWRVEQLVEVQREVGCHALISFEPLLGPITHEIPREIEWVIVGAQTGAGAVAPDDAWVRKLSRGAEPDIPVFEKENLDPIMPRRLWQRWPDALVRETAGKARGLASPGGASAATPSVPEGVNGDAGGGGDG